MEAELNSFDPAARARALTELAARAGRGEVPFPPERPVVNMHCHTFFSFNAYGHSPSSLAWLGKRRGFWAMGIVDFDVLDGVDEFLDACDLLGLRGSAGIETRVFVPEYADQEINSPGEPGICYQMGIGFASGTVPQAVAPILTDLSRRASERNQAILARVNRYLHPVTIDYETDVVPLTPNGHPTERHLVAAYAQAAQRMLPDPAPFWADRLGVAWTEIDSLLADPPRFQTLIRARLIKRGGVGYVEPQSGMFPSLHEFHTLVAACGALPCAAWLDGTTAAEEDPETWLQFMVSKGVVALNIIPDRNWNIADPELRALKVRNLYRLVEVAQALDLPLNVGTEMNSFGQKEVDDFDAPELAPLRQPFLEGASFIYGHTAMQRALGRGYLSDWAQSHLPSRRARNDFYRRLGHLVPPGVPGAACLQRLDPNLSPRDILSRLRH